MPVKKERQYRTAQPLQTRADEQDGTTVEGYAATFGPYLFLRTKTGPSMNLFLLLPLMVAICRMLLCSTTIMAACLRGNLTAR